MTARPPGTVFSYPYLWVVEKDRGLTEAKSRTTCLLLSVPAAHSSGQAFQRLILLGITDTVWKGQAAIEIPATEKRRAGLTVQRPAFVVISEGNEDIFPGSWYYAPGDATYGQFSAKFLAEILIAFRALVKVRKLQLVSRKA